METSLAPRGRESECANARARRRAAGRNGSRPASGCGQHDPRAVDRAVAAGRRRPTGRACSAAAGPSDSLASVQIHQSALNNVCQQLGWDGETLTLPEMREAILEHLHVDGAARAPSTLPDDLSVTFAPQNAIRVKCQDNRIELNMAIARMEKPPQKWQDFTVRVFYKPDLSAPGGTADARRHGAIGRPTAGAEGPDSGCEASSARPSRNRTACKCCPNGSPAIREAGRSADLAIRDSRRLDRPGAGRQGRRNATSRPTWPKSRQPPARGSR